MKCILVCLHFYNTHVCIIDKFAHTTSKQIIATVCPQNYMVLNIKNINFCTQYSAITETHGDLLTKMCSQILYFSKLKCHIFSHVELITQMSRQSIPYLLDLCDRNATILAKNQG